MLQVHALSRLRCCVLCTPQLSFRFMLCGGAPRQFSCSGVPAWRLLGACWVHAHGGIAEDGRRIGPALLDMLPVTTSPAPQTATACAC